MFAQPISMPRFKSIIFYQNSSKIKLVLQKNAKFSSAGDSAPRPPCLWRLGSLPLDPPKQPLPLPIFGDAPARSDVNFHHMHFVLLDLRAFRLQVIRR